MAFEFAILDYLQTLHQPFLDKVMVFISSLGNAGIIWIVLALAFICVKKYRRFGVTMLLALLIGLIIGNGALKNIVARERPCWINETVQLLIAVPKDYSFPSGHTLASFGAATALFWNKKAWGAAAYIGAVLIAFSRMYLYVHFPTDILCGMLLGLCTGTAAWFIVKKYWPVMEKKIQIKE